MMLITNANIYGSDGKFFHGALEISGDTISGLFCGEEAERSEEWILDAGDGFLIPGLVDIHFHGCMGVDFCDGTKEALDKMIDYELSQGVTTIVPATMTLSEERLTEIFRNAGAYEGGEGSPFQGITMEGPFISVKKKGAQNEKYIHVPDADFFRKMQSLSGGKIRQVAVAPEEDKDYAFIKEISKETVISVAHTMADYSAASQAFKAGASHVTHLFNAMPGFTHREPGVVGAALDDPEVFVELICDGIHIHPAMVRAAFAMFGEDRICMISDSMMATGMEDGEYALGGQPVTVRGRLATLKDGTIAGSASSLMDCLRVAVKEMGIPLEKAVAACTATPARSIGLDGKCGKICPGRRADLVLLDKELNLKKVIKSGKTL